MVRSRAGQSHLTPPDGARPRTPRRWSSLPALLALCGLLVVAVGVSVVVPASAAASPTAEVAAAAAADDEVRLLYFYGDGCPYCELQAEYLDDLEARQPDVEVERYEVWNDRDNQQLMVEVLGARGVEVTGVPATVVGDRVWVGFNERIGAQIDAAVDRALATTTPEGDDPTAIDEPPPSATVIDLPLVGEVDLRGQSLVAATGLIAFVDGFNPCSLWVLTVLLAMVLNVGATRRRVFAVGTTFLVVTASIYGLFIAGLFSVFGVVGIATGVAIGVGLLALVVGSVNIKDYLRYKQGVSFTIPDRFKPGIYRQGRAVRDPSRSLVAVLGLTVVMAAGVAIIELPCTAGFPVIWTGLLTTQDVAGAEFVALLLLYLAVYLLLEFGIFLLAVFTLRLGRFQERQGRILKLVGGVVMIALGLVLIIDPDVMDSIVGSTSVVLGSVLVAMVLLVLHRRVLPRFGIVIGDEEALAERRRVPQDR